MDVRDGRMCYEWNGWLVRAKNGALEATKNGKRVWRPFNANQIQQDEELASRLPDLLTYWDKDL